MSWRPPFDPVASRQSLWPEIAWPKADEQDAEGPDPMRDDHEDPTAEGGQSLGAAGNNAAGHVSSAGQSFEPGGESGNHPGSLSPEPARSELTPAETGPASGQMPEGRQEPPSRIAAILSPILWKDLRRLLSFHCEDWLLVDNGRNAETHGHVLPYIAPLDPRHPFTDIVLDNLGKEYGIFLKARPGTGSVASLLAEPLSRVASILLPGERRAHLHWHDPHIFRAFYALATPEQLSFLYGSHIECFWAEDVVTGKLMAYPKPENLPPAPENLVISPEQLQGLLDAQYEKFAQLTEDAVIAEFYAEAGQEMWPGVCISVRKTLMDAEDRFGLTNRKHLRDFVRLVAQYGWNFTENERLQDLVDKERIDSDRMQVVRDFLAGESHA